MGLEVMHFVLLTHNPKNTSREQEGIKLKRKALAPVFPSQHKLIFRGKLCQKCDLPKIGHTGLICLK